MEDTRLLRLACAVFPTIRSIDKHDFLAVFDPIEGTACFIKEADIHKIQVSKWGPVFGIDGKEGHVEYHLKIFYASDNDFPAAVVTLMDKEEANYLAEALANHLSGKAHLSPTYIT